MQAAIYADLVDWDKMDITEPPLTRDLSGHYPVSHGIPLRLPKYPNRTSLRDLVPVFNIKKQDAKF